MDNVKVHVEFIGTYGGKEFRVSHDSEVRLTHKTDPDVGASPSVRLQMIEIRTCETATHLVGHSADPVLWSKLRDMFGKAFPPVDGGKR